MPTSSTCPGGCARKAAQGGLIVTDAVFSMDGDVAPIAELLELARRHGCRLMVDEAHATGALGPGGRGAVAEAGLSGEVDVVVGTLGKTLGSYGAYVCGSAKIVDLLINTARPFIFSTALPPPVIGAALAALTLLDRQPGMVEQLRRNGAILRDALAGHGLDVGASRTQIIPLIVGEARRAMALCERALEGARLRAGDPAADRARGDLAAAPLGDGQPQSRRALGGGGRDRPRGGGAGHRRPGPRAANLPGLAAAARSVAPGCAATSSPARAPR